MISPLKLSDMRKSLALLVEESPGRELIFKRFGLTGSPVNTQTLLELCTAGGIDITEVAHEVYEHEHVLAKQHEIEERTNWNTAPISCLAENIETTHHCYMRLAGPSLLRLGQTVFAETGTHNLYIEEVVHLFETFVDLMMEVVDQEATVFLPMVRKDAENAGLHRRQIAKMIPVMENEQNELSSIMTAISTLTEGFQTPPDAGKDWVALFIGLKETQDNLELYLHKERTFLFPRSLN